VKPERKRVQNRVIRTGVFVERRARHNPLKSKHRRAGDIPPTYARHRDKVHCACYRPFSGGVRACRSKDVRGIILDLHA
jgi:hypothetical protein